MYMNPDVSSGFTSRTCSAEGWNGTSKSATKHPLIFRGCKRFVYKDVKTSDVLTFRAAQVDQRTPAPNLLPCAS